jgi:hypothetical protein
MALFPEFQSELHFVEQMVTEESVFCLPSKVFISLVGKVPLQLGSAFLSRYHFLSAYRVSVLKSYYVLKACAMAEVVSCQPLNAEAQVHAWVSPSEICGGQVALGQVFLGILCFSPVTIIPQWFSGGSTIGLLVAAVETNSFAPLI